MTTSNRQAALERLATALKDRWFQIADTEVIGHHLSHAWNQLADAALAAVEQTGPEEARSKTTWTAEDIAHENPITVVIEHGVNDHVVCVTDARGNTYHEQAAPEGLRCTCGHICVSTEAWNEGEVCYHLPTCDLETGKRSDPLADARAALRLVADIVDRDADLTHPFVQRWLALPAVVAAVKEGKK